MPTVARCTRPNSTCIAQPSSSPTRALGGCAFAGYTVCVGRHGRSGRRGSCTADSLAPSSRAIQRGVRRKPNAPATRSIRRKCVGFVKRAIACWSTHPLKRCTGVLFHFSACPLDQLRIRHARRTRRLTAQTPHASVDMRSCLHPLDAPLHRLAHQVNPSARRLRLLTCGHIGWARLQTQTAVNTLLKVALVKPHACSIPSLCGTIQGGGTRAGAIRGVAAPAG
jgi:hypothetical protein